MMRFDLSREPRIAAAIILLVFGLLVAADAFGRVLAEQNADCGQTNPSDEFAAQRENMVRDQIEKRGIRDPRVRDAMHTVKRHLFVPEKLRSLAYADRPLPIGHGQTISQPYIVAFMTEALNLNADDRVLEIGTGSGYQAAVLGEICRGVYTIEIIEPLGATPGICWPNSDMTMYSSPSATAIRDGRNTHPLTPSWLPAPPVRFPNPFRTSLLKAGG
jgi:hypothetical protein